MQKEKRTKADKINAAALLINPPVPIEEFGLCRLAVPAAF
jgi:hypothetical protein